MHWKRPFQKLSCILEPIMGSRFKKNSSHGSWSIYYRRIQPNLRVASWSSQIQFSLSKECANLSSRMTKTIAWCRWKIPKNSTSFLSSQPSCLLSESAETTKMESFHKSITKTSSSRPLTDSKLPLALTLPTLRSNQTSKHPFSQVQWKSTRVRWMVCLKSRLAKGPQQTIFAHLEWPQTNRGRRELESPNLKSKTSTN